MGAGAGVCARKDANLGRMPREGQLASLHPCQKDREIKTLTLGGLEGCHLSLPGTLRVHTTRLAQLVCPGGPSRPRTDRRGIQRERTLGTHPHRSTAGAGPAFLGAGEVASVGGVAGETWPLAAAICAS